MNSSQSHASSPGGSRAELTELASQGDDEAVSRLEAIRGSARELLGSSTLTEPPNFDGYAVISAEGFGDKVRLQSVSWYPNEGAAYASIMLHGRELDGTLPNPDLVDKVGFIASDDFPLGTYFQVTQLDATKFTALAGWQCDGSAT